MEWPVIRDWLPQRNLQNGHPRRERLTMTMTTIAEQELRHRDEFAAAPPRSELGVTHPLGATLAQGGVNFSVYSRSATSIELILFDGMDPRPSRIIPIHSASNRTYHYWHVFV